MKKACLYAFIFNLAFSSLAAARNVYALDGASGNDQELGPNAPARRRLMTTDIYANITEYALKSYTYVAPDSAARGTSATTGTATNSKVAFGIFGKTGQFPFLVNLNPLYCGGTIIAPRVVLTAAYCVCKDGKFIKEKISILHSNANYELAEEISVKRMWVPKDYEEDYRTADLAILELAKAVPSSIRPIKLATPSTKLPSKVTVAGWGDDKPMADYTTIVTFKYATMPVIKRAACRRYLTELLNFKKDMLYDGSICFGLGKTPHHAACAGDNGGPFFTMNSGKAVQFGIVSNGADGYRCGDSTGNIDFATSIPYWRGYIETIIKQNKLRP